MKIVYHIKSHIASYLLHWLIITIITSVILFFLFPFLAGPREKFLKWAFKNTKIRTQIKKDLKTLENIEKFLRFIIQLPSFPDDTKPEKLINTINEIRFKALKIKSSRFAGIKQILLSYSIGDYILRKGAFTGVTLSLANRYLASDLAERIRALIHENLNKKKTNDI